MLLINVASPSFQRQVLQALAANFNRFVDVEDIAVQVGCSIGEMQDMLTLLIDLGLAKAIDVTTMDSSGKEWISPSITALGLRHAGADGGIGRAVSTVNVAFDADTLRALIAARVTDSAFPEDEKSKWRS